MPGRDHRATLRPPRATRASASPLARLAVVAMNLRMGPTMLRTVAMEISSSRTSTAALYHPYDRALVALSLHGGGGRGRAGWDAAMRWSRGRQICNRHRRLLLGTISVPTRPRFSAPSRCRGRRALAGHFGERAGATDASSSAHPSRGFRKRVGRLFVESCQLPLAARAHRGKLVIQVLDPVIALGSRQRLGVLLGSVDSNRAWLCASPSSIVAS